MKRTENNIPSPDGRGRGPRNAREGEGLPFSSGRAEVPHPPGCAGPLPLPSGEGFQVDVAIEDIWQNLDFDAETLVQKIVPLTLTAAKFNEPTEISLLLTDNATIQQLNKQHRGKNKPTNVLSFPMNDEMLGDIIIAYETMCAEANHMNVPAQDHFTHLLIHGTLHLLGYDHEEETQAKTMENLEISILSGLGIENPYSRPNFLA